MRPPVEIRIHDASISIWQDSARDPSSRQVYAGLIKRMRGHGWAIREDPNVKRNHTVLSPSHRLGARGTLRVSVEIAGRCVKVEFWSITAPQVNRNGRRYDYDRMRNMHHIDRLRIEIEFRRVIRWLEKIAPVTVDRGNDCDTAPMERIQKRYAENWHTDKDLGHPICKSDSNRKAADGTLLDHGQTVWIPDRKGRIIRGTAYYNINNMWWVVAGGQLFNEGCGRLFSSPPADLRIKRNERSRRTMLEQELALAIRRMQFLRADQLKRILYGADPVFMIWASDHNAYYRSQYAGYTTDVISAGKYTRIEAERECRRCPSDLSMVDQDGNHTRFDEVAA